MLLLGELFQELYIVFEECVQVVDFVVQYCEMFYVQVECEVGVVFWIDVYVVQYVWVDYVVIEYFQLVGVVVGLLLGDVYFGVGFDEWEVVGVEVYFEVVFEECVYEFGQCVFQVGEGGMFVDQQVFDLVEYW